MSAVRVAVSSGGVIDCLSGTEPWRPRILAGRGGCARVALVQSRASLLRADDVALSVEVGPGASLELVELGALLAHSVRGGTAARMTVEVSVGEEGRLIWLGQPLIVGAGAAVSASLTAELAAGARMLRGDAVVVGASFGALQSRTRIVLDGVPLLDETLSTVDPVTLRSAVVAGDATMIAAVTLAGTRDQAAPPGAMQAHGPATLWRDAGGTVEVGASAAAIGERWRGHCRSPHTDARTAGYVLGDTIRR